MAMANFESTHKLSVGSGRAKDKDLLQKGLELSNGFD